MLFLQGHGTAKWHQYCRETIFRGVKFVLNPAVRHLTAYWQEAQILCYGHLTTYAKLRVAHAPGMPGTFLPATTGYDPDIHHGTCVTYVPWWMTGSLTSGFLWSWWRGTRSRHSRRMRNPQFCLSGKRPINTFPFKLILTSTFVIWAFQLNGHYKGIGMFWKIHKQYVLIRYVNYPYGNDGVIWWSY